MQSNKFVEMTLWAIWWLVVGSAGVWVLVGSIGYFNKLDWIPETVAYWVQAIGSVGAIIVAIFISRASERRSNRDAQKKSRIMELAICNLAGLAGKSILSLKSKLPHQEGWEEGFPFMSLSEVEAHRNTLSSLDLTIFPSEAILAPFIELKAEAEKIISLVKELQVTLENQSEFVVKMGEIDSAVERSTAAIKKIESAVSV